MSYSKVTICNKALGLLSSDQMLTFDEDTTQGALCRSQYDVVLRTTLEEHAWSFAIKSRVLSPKSNIPFGYDHEFSVPSDCLRILSVSDKEIPRNNSQNNFQFDWAVESGGILCNSEVAYLVYVFNNEVTDTYSSSFVDLVSLRLASELSHVLTESSRLYHILVERYEQRLSRAITNDSMQGVNRKFGRTTFTRDVR